MKSLLTLIIFSLTLSIFAQSSMYRSGYRSVVSIPENVGARRVYRDIITGPINLLRSAQPHTGLQAEDGRRVRFEVREEGEALFVLFVNQKQGEFRLNNQGSYVIKRNPQDGSFEQVKIFYKDDWGSYLRIFPENERSRLDIYLYGSGVYKNINLPIEFTRLLTEPFSRLISLTESRLNWELLLNSGRGGRNPQIEEVARIVRSELRFLGDAEDGALDEKGELVYIESGERQSGRTGFNCSGFAKWVIDGLYLPETGRLTNIQELKNPQTQARGTSRSAYFEEARDPYFGLDWTRSLAVKIMELHDGRRYNPEAADVRQVEFFKYTEDVGYPIASLKPLMYYLAINEPGHFYLGSINNSFGSGPVLRQHTHVAVFFPYIDQKNALRIAVMERNKETSVESLRKRYANDFVHLTRVKVYNNYALPELKFE